MVIRLITAFIGFIFVFIGTFLVVHLVLSVPFIEAASCSYLSYYGGLFPLSGVIGLLGLGLALAYAVFHYRTTKKSTVEITADLKAGRVFPKK